MMVIIWCGFIFYMSSQTATDSSEMSMATSSFLEEAFFTTYINEIFTADMMEGTIRKLAHVFEYTVLGILAARAFLVTKKRNIYKRWCSYSWFFCFFYACTDEFHQFFVEGRGAAFQDVIIDSIGFTCGILMVFGLCGKNSYK